MKIKPDRKTNINYYIRLKSEAPKIMAGQTYKVSYISAVQ